MGIDNYTDSNADNRITISGYICGACGAWVAYGEYHACYGNYRLSWTATNTKSDAPDLARIAAALERIADVLEKMR